MGEYRGVYRNSVGKPEERRALGRPRRRREVNNKVDLQEVGCGSWTGSSCLRIGTGGEAVVNVVMNFRIPQNAGNFLNS